MGTGVKAVTCSGPSTAAAVSVPLAIGLRVNRFSLSKTDVSISPVPLGLTEETSLIDVPDGVAAWIGWKSMVTRLPPIEEAIGA